MRTIAHLYDSYTSAQSVVTELESAGFSHDQVSIVANQGSSSTGTTGAITGARTTGMGTTGTSTTGMGTTGMGTTTGTGAVGQTVASEPAATGAGTGASVGTLLGGGAGLLAGIGALAIPGVGPVVAAGWLIATLTGAGAGAAAGGLLGSLTGAGVSEDNANVYTEGVRRGSTLVTVRAEDTQAAQAETIMQRYHPVDIAQRGADYRSTGDWSRFDETRGSMTAEEMQAERTRVGTRTGI